ncbi:glutamyl-tRNA reductase [Acetohalobium arabaticum]|uniref:Glutamyl-tRNA reductase n=1 Tax=Acetohalobium arabaticum (strain ATCC 49924 / DSM 5501 / Z-7288) TaxID=574087 RepID=D9QV25_ACEAZ|nr:glutamyl-tRNA reductase [Acetohalobium arabaticum]ADL12084.1 glutamyl-tRNA reductase [Acetohalobium arabaticum DSM 5501]
MTIVAMGLNHKTAPVEIREQISFTSQEKEDALNIIGNQNKISEGILLATCNRTEVYVISSNQETGIEFILELLSQFSTLDQSELSEYLYTYSDLDAVTHLYKVASGLDSMVLGEEQILGQIKEAFELAKDQDTIDTILHHLFTEALKVGKRARSETSINDNAASVSYAAVELANKIFGSLDRKRVLILGTGEMSKLTLKNLVDHGVEDIVVANRTFSKAQNLALEFDGQAIRWKEIEDWLNQIDIVISSTAAPHYVIRYDMIEKILPNRDHKPLFFIDIAVPRDIEPEIHNLPNVYAYNIDDLESVVNANLKEREKAIKFVKRIIKQEVTAFDKWRNSRNAVPIIKSLRKQAEEIRQEELQRAFAKLDDIGEEEKNIVKSLTHKIVNKLLHNPTVQVKEFANIEESQLYLEAVSELFCLNSKENEQM